MQKKNKINITVSSPGSLRKKTEEHSLSVKKKKNVYFLFFKIKSILQVIFEISLPNRQKEKN